MPGYGTAASRSAVARQAATLDTIVGYGYFAPARLALDEVQQRSVVKAAQFGFPAQETRPQAPSNATPPTPGLSPPVQTRLSLAVSSWWTLRQTVARCQDRLRAATTRPVIIGRR